MIKKIIKNRKQIASAAAMVATVYVLIAIHSVRRVYERQDSRVI